MVRFSELANASEEMIEKILESVEGATLATALQGANARLIDRVLGGRSPDAIEQVLRNIQRQQAASLSQIESARRQVTDIAERLEAAGIAASG